MHYVHSLRKNLQAASLVETRQLTNYVIIVDTKGQFYRLQLSFLTVPGKAAGTRTLIYNEWTNKG